MKGIDLIAIDLDGTLLNDNKIITQRNIEVINKAIDSGKKIVLCTGRTLPGIKRFVNQLNIAKPGEFVLVNNGITIYELDKYKIVSDMFIPLEKRNKLVNFVTDFDNVATVAFDENHFYYHGKQTPSKWVINDAETLDTKITSVSKHFLINHTPVHKFINIAEESLLNQVESSIPDEIRARYKIIRSLPHIIEYLPLGVSKWSRLKVLLDYLEIEEDRVMAIGDQLNDLEMIEHARIGVAMENAHEEIKKRADIVTYSNNEDGVGHIIEQIL